MSWSVTLPCKIEDPAWYVIDRGRYSTLCSTTVSKIEILDVGRYVLHLVGTIRKVYVGSPQDDNAFLTVEKAGERLRELKGRND